MIFCLIDQREWPFILPGPRTRVWREMWHETFEFQSGEVPEERYVLALAVNCRNKENIKFRATNPSPRWFCTDALSHFPRKFNGRILEVPIDPGRCAIELSQYTGKSPAARSQLPSPTSLERRRAANCGRSARIVIQGGGL